LYLGAFREEIEPQVRDAVYILLKKGYELTCSGFGGADRSDEQYLVGYFSVDETTKEELKKRNVQVRTENRINTYPDTPITEISFQCENDDINSIMNKWNEVANLLPSLGDKMTPTRVNSHFRTLYAPNRIDMEIFDLERRLEEEVLADDIKERIFRRLEESHLEQKSKEEGLTDIEKDRLAMLRKQAFEEETDMLENLDKE